MFPVVISLPDIYQRSSRSQHHNRLPLTLFHQLPQTAGWLLSPTDFLEILQLCSCVDYLFNVKCVVKNNLFLRAEKPHILFVMATCWQRHSPVRPLASQHLCLSDVEDKAVYLNQRYCSITKYSVMMGNNPKWYRRFPKQSCPQSRRKLERPIYLGSLVCLQLSLAKILPCSYSESLSPHRIKVTLDCNFRNLV